MAPNLVCDPVLNVQKVVDPIHPTPTPNRALRKVRFHNEVRVRHIVTYEVRNGSFHRRKIESTGDPEKDFAMLSDTGKMVKVERFTQAADTIPEFKQEFIDHIEMLLKLEQSNINSNPKNVDSSQGLADQRAAIAAPKVSNDSNGSDSSFEEENHETDLLMEWAAETNELLKGVLI